MIFHQQILLLFLLLATICTKLMSAVFVDYAENMELIQQRVGYDVKLTCCLKGLVGDNQISDVKIHWFFKQCNGVGAALTSANNCNDFQEDDWTQLPCGENFCKPELLLRNVTERYSGLYKCTVYPYHLDGGHTLDIQLVRTYQLDVKNTSVAVPEFVDSYPLNKTASVGTQVVFQCRVHSEVHPTIKWFRRHQALADTEHTQGNENFNAHIVRYNGYTYELLSTAREKLISDEIYLSKLILNGVRAQDEGHYACVAISYRGHKIREAYLQVTNEEPEYWADYDDADERPSDPREFVLLFLIPLGLAVLPLFVWLSYLSIKKCRTNVEQEKCTDENNYMLRV